MIQLQWFFQCPNDNCAQLFIGYYKEDDTVPPSWTFRQTSIGTIKGKVFSENIQQVSKGFIDIYNQSVEAEHHGLTEICGIGYRKALEFLIKDYLISNLPDEEEHIKKKLLGKCINDYVENPNIKEMAKRAVWLGNDETHYIRRWENKDINDLKILIDITVHWIEMEVLTNKYKDDME
jgi:hypothetical protein